MSHYSDDPRTVRVDFFKSSGRWYETNAVKWTGEWKEDGQLIYDAFKQSLRDHFQDSKRLSDMDAICLEPYHEYSHPIQLKNGSWNEEEDGLAKILDYDLLEELEKW